MAAQGSYDIKTLPKAAPQEDETWPGVVMQGFPDRCGN